MSGTNNLDNILSQQYGPGLIAKTGADGVYAIAIKPNTLNTVDNSMGMYFV